MILNSPYISGSLTVTGNIIASGSITMSGSIASASFAASATSASYALNATSASYALNSTSASFATRAITASYSDALTVAGTLTAQTLVVQTITSSVDFVTGSTRFGSTGSNTHTFTGSVLVTGSSTFTGDILNNGVLYLGSNSTVQTTDRPHLFRIINGGLGISANNEVGVVGGSSPQPIIFYTSGSSRLTISSDGTVGIGITTPSQKFHVFGASDGTKGRFELYGTAGINEVLQIVNTANWNPSRGVKVGLYVNSGSNANQLGAEIGATTISGDALGADLFFTTTSGSVTTEKMRITNTGNIGIGTTLPVSTSNYIFTTTNAVSGSGYITQVNGTTALYSYSNSTESRLAEQRAMALIFETSGTERLRITSDGKLKLTSTSAGGTNLDMYLLENDGLYINSNESATARAIYFQTGGTTKATITSIGTLNLSGVSQKIYSNNETTNYAYFQIDNTGGSITMGIERSTGGGLANNTSAYSGLISTNNATALAFGTNVTERMRITSAGKLLVNRTNTIFTNSGHVIQGDVSAGGEPVLEVYNQNLADSAPAIACFKNSSTTSSSARFIQFYSNGGVQAMGGIVGNGATNVQFASISDIREKENITSINGSLNKILLLNPVEFDWIKTGEHTNAGFVAQEVETIFPEYVVENMSNDGEEERKGLTGGMSSGIVAHLVKAIQELKAQNDDLQSQINELKAQ